MIYKSKGAYQGSKQQIKSNLAVKSEKGRRMAAVKFLLEDDYFKKFIGSIPRTTFYPQIQYIHLQYIFVGLLSSFQQFNSMKLLLQVLGLQLLTYGTIT